MDIVSIEKVVIREILCLLLFQSLDCAVSKCFWITKKWQNHKSPYSSTIIFVRSILGQIYTNSGALLLIFYLLALTGELIKG